MKSNAKSHFIAMVTLISYLGAVSFFGSGIARAEGAAQSLEVGNRNSKYTRADEYFSELYQGEILVPIQLLGSVSKPGVYHIPKQTDVVRLLALAGGTRPDANLEEVSIKRRSQETERVININLKQLINEKGGGRPVNLEANDIVLVAPNEPTISANTVQVVGLTASLLGLIVSSLVIVNQLKK